MAGGTGGHVFPALAIADELKKHGYEVRWLGTRGRMEEKLVPKYGYPIDYINVRGIRRNGLMAKIKAPFMVFRAILESLKIIRKFKPDAVLGMGGYASGPGGIAAFICRIPVILHEQNAAAGLTNRLLFKISKRVMLGFPGAFSGKKVEVVGNPVRTDILKLHGLKRNFREDKLRIAVVGGSLGAQALNTIVPNALKLVKNLNFTVTHQCGGGHLESVKEQYKDAKFNYEIFEFVNNMQDLYLNHDLVICRAGALTVAETSVASIPALFVPLPSAVDDHQTKNALSLKERGAAMLCPQKELSYESLSQTILDLIEHREKLEKMSENLTLCAITNATEKAFKIIESICEKK